MLRYEEILRLFGDEVRSPVRRRRRVLILLSEVVHILVDQQSSAESVAGFWEDRRLRYQAPSTWIHSPAQRSIVGAERGAARQELKMNCTAVRLLEEMKANR